jgi:three-Cys-motif partner protein
VTKSDKHFEAFADHTLLKHAILHAYLQSWAFKILQWGEAGNTVYYVDGFAGAGRDGKRNPGSPVIACRIAQVVRGHLASGPKPRTVQLKVLAVESDPATLVLLEQQLAPFKRLDVAALLTYSGSVSEHMGAIATEIGMRPALFFLDPFGLKGLDAATYSTMLSGGHSEIFALFHDIGAARLRGVVHADAGVEQQLQAIKELPSLFPELDAEVAHELEAKADKKRKIVDQLGPSARDAISRALGDSSWEVELRHLSPGDARSELILRFVRKLIASGARYVQVLPMSGESGGHKYCLVHASKSLKGYTTMKEAVSESLKKDDLSLSMRDRMREDLRVPVSEILEFLQQRFRGQTIRWSGKKGADVGTIKRALLDETSMFHFQAMEIKDELRGRGWFQRLDRVEQVRVPSS